MHGVRTDENAHRPSLHEGGLDLNYRCTMRTAPEEFNLAAHVHPQDLLNALITSHATYGSEQKDICLLHPKITHVTIKATLMRIDATSVRRRCATLA